MDSRTDRRNNWTVKRLPSALWSHATHERLAILQRLEYSPREAAPNCMDLGLGITGTDGVDVQVARTNEIKIASMFFADTPVTTFRYTVA